MRLINARFDILGVEWLDDGRYKITGNVVDNTATYYATDLQPGDIIYADGIPYGYDVLRYKINSIESGTSGVRLVADISWDIPELEAMEPFDGLDALIGSRQHDMETINVTNFTVNSASEKLITDVRNYQQLLTNKTFANYEFNELMTDAKTLIGAINEIYDMLNNVSPPQETEPVINKAKVGYTRVY